MPVRRDQYWWKKRLQEKVSRTTGGRLHIFEAAKHGISDVEDLRRATGRVGTIIDVGANTGQSAIRFRAAFPHARIISIEPVRETFDELKRRTEGLDIESYRLALGAEPGLETIYLTPFSTTNSIVKPPDDEVRGVEEVEMTTLDHLMEMCRVETIDLLKIDVEGFDLQVLHGGQAALSSGRIRFVLTEVGLNPEESRHVLLDNVRDELSYYGFRVFGLYGQTLEWSGEKALRFANAMFCRSDGHAPRLRNHD